VFTLESELDRDSAVSKKKQNAIYMGGKDPFYTHICMTDEEKQLQVSIELKTL